MSPSSLECAAELLDVVPLLMRAMRAEVRRHGAPELSMPQFRALAFIGRNEGAALTDVGAFLGLALPSASKLIDGLVAQHFVVREIAPKDRRRIRLALSPAGRRRYEAIVVQSRQFIAGKVAHFTATQRQQLTETLTALRQIFEPDTVSEVVRSDSARRKSEPVSNGFPTGSRPTSKKHPHV